MKKKNNNIISRGLNAGRYLLLLASGIPFASNAQAVPTPSENYTYTQVYLSEDGSRKAETVQYFDDLGRPRQSVQVKATPLGRDLVVPVVYDALGRQTRSLLPVPVPTANLGIQNVSENSVNTYYGVPNAYTEQKLEASPLARPLEIAHPGTEWAMGSGHTQKIGYGLNKNADQVKKYTVTHSWQNATAVSSLPAVSFYSEKMLAKTTATDEDGNQAVEFKNGLGQTVLVRKVISSAENADTYYIYNDYGHLVYVISPKASQMISANGNTVTQQILDLLCYQYRYDNRGRLVEKKLPGKGWEFMVYDRQNRLVLSQDAGLRTTTNSFNAKGWMFTKYDQLGRVVYTGFFANTGTRTAMQAALNGMAANAGNNEARSGTSFSQNGMDIYYTKNAFPTGSMTILSVSYYDTYPSYSFNPAFPAAIYGKAVLTDQSSAPVSTRTLPVMTLVKNIEDHGWTKSYVYYDQQARAIGSHSVNHLGGYTRTESDLDFAGVPQQVATRHKRLATDPEKVILEQFTYDAQNRLVTHTHQVDGRPKEILAQNTYDELSRPLSRKTGGTDAAMPLQATDYTYNIRGWTVKVNDPSNLGNRLFGYELRYGQPQNIAVSAKYNGNIAEAHWKSAADGVYRRYSYRYDPLGRLAEGKYAEPYSTVSANDYFNEEISYDLNGNIASLKRFAKPSSGTVAEKIDDLVYNYEDGNLSNKLSVVTLPPGTANNPSGYNALGYAIGYDDNGNMTSWKDKGISGIRYNFLNLPLQITSAQGNTSYLYRADGTKLKKTAGSKTVEYLDGFQYENGVLKFFATAEGYYDTENARYVYHCTDHLGNVRVSYFKNAGGSAEVLEENNYYPFGLKHQGYNQTAGNPSYTYRYNGKEEQENGMYDYGARFYMPELGRWGVVDPMAEVSRRFSPYVYGNSNPVRFTDPDGRITVDNLSGQYSLGSAVADFIRRNGFDDSHLPQLYSDDSGIMIVNTALGDNGEGGGGSSTSSTALLERMLSLGGTWTNTGTGFESDSHIALGYDGGYQSLNTTLDGYINIPEVVLRGNSSGWGAQMQNHFNSFMKDWYTWGGRGNWFFGTGATLSGFAGVVQSENMYSQGIRRGLSGNYMLTGRNLSQFGNMAMTNATAPVSGLAKWGGRLSRVSFGAGMVMDGIGVLNYRNNPNSPNAVHPAKAGFNTVMGYVGLKGGVYGAVISTLYFGVDSFYPGGWVGASETAARTEAYEQQVTGHPFFSNSAIKF